MLIFMSRRTITINRIVSVPFWRTVSTKMSSENNPIEKSITEKIKIALSPVHMEIINESYQHNVPKGSETHFKVMVVAEKFEKISLIQRHRMINEILDNELKNGVHALSIVAKAPSQWQQADKLQPSPKCMGGFGK